jgi:hypothetical protein
LKISSEFRHQIVNDRFQVTVWRGSIDFQQKAGSAGRWIALSDLAGIPLTTVARKALADILPVN